jgi:hypothetical protein
MTNSVTNTPTEPSLEGQKMRQEFEAWAHDVRGESDVSELEPAGWTVWQAAYAAGCAAERERGWIAVEEKLPPAIPSKSWMDRGRYDSSDIVLAFNGQQTTAEMLTNPHGNNVWVCGDQTVKGVTHWRPLPDPPVASAIRGKEK